MAVARAWSTAAAVRACLMLTVQAEGANVVTVEGLSSDARSALSGNYDWLGSRIKLLPLYNAIRPTRRSLPDLGRAAIPDARRGRARAIDPLPADGGGSRPEPELDLLSNILRTFNDLWGNIAWSDGDRVRRLIAEEIPQKVAVDPAYQNARKYSDKQNARIEHDEALRRVIVGLMKDDTDLFRLFSDSPDFKRWLGDTVFGITYRQQPS